MNVYSLYNSCAPGVAKNGPALYRYIDDRKAYEELQKEGYLIQVPHNTDDDKFLIHTAMEAQGLIISRDKFKDHRSSKRINDYVKLNLLKFTFVDKGFVQLTFGRDMFL